MSSSESEPDFILLGALADSISGAAEEHCVPECPDQYDLSDLVEATTVRSALDKLTSIMPEHSNDEIAEIIAEIRPGMIVPDDMPEEIRAKYRKHKAEQLNTHDAVLEEVRGRRCALAATCQGRPVVMKKVMGGVTYELTMCSSPEALDVDGNARVRVVRKPVTE